MLTQAGIQFKRHEEEGIELVDFAELLTSSGLVLREEINWITFARCLKQKNYCFGGLYPCSTNSLDATVVILCMQTLAGYPPSLLPPLLSFPTTLSFFYHPFFFLPTLLPSLPPSLLPPLSSLLSSPSLPPSLPAVAMISAT